MYIYVLPSEEGQPPRAVLTLDEPQPGEEMAGALATWSRDQGCWLVEGEPAPKVLDEAITDHAKDLGVSW